MLNTTLTITDTTLYHSTRFVNTPSGVLSSNALPVSTLLLHPQWSKTTVIINLHWSCRRWYHHGTNLLPGYFFCTNEQWMWSGSSHIPRSSSTSSISHDLHWVGYVIIQQMVQNRNVMKIWQWGHTVAATCTGTGGRLFLQITSQ